MASYSSTVTMPSYDAATQRWSDETTVRTTGGSVGTPLASVKDMLSSLGPAYAASFASAMNAVAPGWKDIMGRLEGGIRDLLGGKLPADVTSMIESTMAEKNLAGGRYGQVADSATARTLGLTSLDMVGKGMDEANKYLQIAKGMSPQVENLQGLIGNALQYQTASEQLALQKSELSYSMAANTQKQADSTALQKLQLLLTAQGQQAELSETGREFDAKLDWTKQFTDFERKYRSFVDSTNQRLLQDEIARKEKEQQTVMSKSGYGDTGYKTWEEQLAIPVTYTAPITAGNPAAAAAGNAPVYPAYSGPATGRIMVNGVEYGSVEDFLNQPPSAKLTEGFLSSKPLSYG